MLVGRGNELAVLDKLLADAADNRGSGLVLRGEPGIGKTALLEYALANAPGYRVLRVIGVEAESQLVYAALHQLLLPVLDRIDQLPAPQATALRTAFGLHEGAGVEPFLVFMAVLTLLSDLAEDQPVLCIIDDAQWCDAPSLDALTFVGRRLEAEPIALLIAVRDNEGREVDATGMAEIPLSGLDKTAAAQLLTDRITPPALEHLVRNTGGNPLAMIELAETLDDSKLVAHEVLAEPLPLPSRLERVFLNRVQQLDPQVRMVLLLAAAEGAGRLYSIRQAAAQLGLADSVIDASLGTGLLKLTGNTVVFQHPLVRSAIYQGAAPTDRLAAHQALAHAFESDSTQADRRAWHRARATEGTNDEVAADLELSAEQAQNRSGHLAAAATLEKAAELSSDPADQVRRLVAAARASWTGGDSSTASTLLGRAESLHPKALKTVLEIQYLHGAIELRTGTPTQALAILAPAASAAANVDPGLALRIVLMAREAAYTSGAATPGLLAELAAAVAKLPTFDHRDDQLIVDALRVLLEPRMDHARAAAAADRLRDSVHLAEPELLLVAGGMAWAVGEYTLATRLRTKAVIQARSMGAAGTLALTLEYLVPEEITLGHYSLATALADEGRKLAMETGRRNSACLHLAYLSMLAALRGKEAEAKQLADQAMAAAIERQLVKVADIAHRAIGLLALAARQPAEALEAYQKLDGRGPEPGSPVLAVSAIPDRIEAAVRAEAVEQARPLLDHYLTWVNTVGSTELRALAARSKALLAATSTEADAHYQEALCLHANTGSTFDHARTELLYGEFLRRERQRVQARTHLRAALEAFTKLGTPLWAERAQLELRATGETVRKRVVDASEELTPQELQVAQAVRAGLTNREVAAQLFISPRTVDYHLRKVFRKLGITSRRELTV